MTAKEGGREGERGGEGGGKQKPGTYLRAIGGGREGINRACFLTAHKSREKIASVHTLVHAFHPRVVLLLVFALPPALVLKPLLDFGGQGGRRRRGGGGREGGREGRRDVVDVEGVEGGR